MKLTTYHHDDTLKVWRDRLAPWAKRKKNSDDSHTPRRRKRRCVHRMNGPNSKASTNTKGA
jgi:hypothetical protein